MNSAPIPRLRAFYVWDPRFPSSRGDEIWGASSAVELVGMLTEDAAPAALENVAIELIHAEALNAPNDLLNGGTILAEINAMGGPGRCLKFNIPPWDEFDEAWQKGTLTFPGADV